MYVTCEYGEYLGGVFRLENNQVVLDVLGVDSTDKLLGLLAGFWSEELQKTVTSKDGKVFLGALQNLREAGLRPQLVLHEMSAIV